MVAMAEELGLEMAILSLEHLLQYGEHNIRRAVPLALGPLCISNPKVNVMDTLSRLSHDSDSDVAMAAIISLGLIGAGTNNARIDGMLRNLSSYYYKEASLLFCVRIAQGLLTQITHLTNPGLFDANKVKRLVSAHLCEKARYFDAVSLFNRKGEKLRSVEQFKFVTRQYV